LKNDSQCSDSSTQTQADGESKLAQSEFRTTNYVVQGWRDANGNLWKINKLVTIDDPFLFNQRIDMLVKKVTFKLSNTDGMITEIEVAPPDGIKSGNKAASSKTAVSKKKFSDTKRDTGGIYLNPIAGQ
jgi:prophage tail gpP-like protein